MLKPYEHLAAWKKSKFGSVFLLNLLLHYWFFINLQMLTGFAFLKTSIIIFCLIYSLNIPYRNQNASFFLVECSVLIFSKFISWQHFTILSWVVRLSHENNFDISFIYYFILFYHFHGRWTCVRFWWQIQST